MMCRGCIPLFGLLLSGTPVASSEMYPDPARYCKNYADEVGCRERHSGGLHCRDTSKCNLGNCSDADAARRVGMTCAGFPWWNGGWPLSALHWDEEREFYECDTTASPSSTSDYCSQWITIEDSEDEWEVGVCKCTQGRNDNELGRPYCANWTCEQVEVDKCKGSARMKVRSRFDGGDGAWLQGRFPGFRPSRRGDWDKYEYVCMCTDSETMREYECGPQVETEKTDCSCLEVTNQGVCKRWYCREYDDAGRHDVEHEYYTATAIRGSTGRVHRWVGDIDSRGEFEMAECECTLPSDNGRFCVEWQCWERGLPYFYPNLLISLVVLLLVCPFAVGAWGGLGWVIKRVAEEDDKFKWNSCRGALYIMFAVMPFLPVIGFTILFLWLGGVGELVIVLSISVGLPLVILSADFVNDRRPGGYFDRKRRAEGFPSSLPANPMAVVASPREVQVGLGGGATPRESPPPPTPPRRPHAPAPRATDAAPRAPRRIWAAARARRAEKNARLAEQRRVAAVLGRLDRHLGS